jgi:hypothetical protein
MINSSPLPRLGEDDEVIKKLKSPHWENRLYLPMILLTEDKSYMSEIRPFRLSSQKNTKENKSL